MKKTLIAAAVMAASGVAFAASNVTLYGVIEEGVLLEKAKHQDTTVQLKSGFDQGSRWGIKGVEDLGNGYSVGFILEQGFTADDGNAATSVNWVSVALVHFLPERSLITSLQAGRSELA